MPSAAPPAMARPATPTAAAAASSTRRPIAFTDRDRARERSALRALYQVIEQGLEGTSMPSFGTPAGRGPLGTRLPFGRFAYPDASAGGRAPLAGRQALRQHIPDHRRADPYYPGGAGRPIGEATAPRRSSPIFARHPEARHAAWVGQFAGARPAEARREPRRLRRPADRRAATELALSAYLDGFEPVEPTLNARDAS